MRPASGGTAAVSPSPLRVEGEHSSIAGATAQPSVECGDNRAVVGSGPISGYVCAITMDCLRVRRGPRPAEYCTVPAKLSRSLASINSSGLMSTTMAPPWRGAQEIVGHARTVGTDSRAELELKGFPA